MTYAELYSCYTCGKEFYAGRAARDSHCRATGHQVYRFECISCPCYFNSANARDQHMRDTGHDDEEEIDRDDDDDSDSDEDELECMVCDEVFATIDEAADHEVFDHYYCALCDRFFRNYNNIKMHLNSRIHRGQDISCPLCKKPFTTAAGVAHHYEQSACPNARGLNRDQIYRLVRSRDPQGHISKNLVDWKGSTTYEATTRTWNGYGYVCYLCRRAFAQLGSLDQHLNSPAHQQALYHCPKFECRMEFKTLAAIINHLESESCGYMRFEQVQSTMGNLVGFDHRVTY